MSITVEHRMHDIIRAARIALLAFSLLLGARYAWSGSNLPIASAQPRIPQVAVNGTGLQQLFDTFWESIVVSRDQIDVGLFTAVVSNNSTYTCQVELAAAANGTSSGIYNGHASSPALMQVFPVTATAGWFAVISYRVSPVRATVNVFDANAVLKATTTYPGADRQGIGFYVDGPGGTVYSQDTRNPGGAPQLLFFRGTGVNRGAAWLAAETQPLPSGS